MKHPTATPQRSLLLALFLTAATTTTTTISQACLFLLVCDVKSRIDMTWSSKRLAESNDSC